MSELSQPFLVTLTIGSAYLPPKAMPTLDAILWSAVKRVSEGEDDMTSCMPLCRTERVFHGSGMLCEPMFPVLPVKFFQSICNERKEDDLLPQWLDTRLYKGSSVDVGKIKSGISGKGTFSVKTDGYTALSRGKLWKVGFYGCGDMRRVESLLHLLPGIGRKASRGYGAITDIEVEPKDHDFSMMRDGLPMRPIPIEIWERMGGRMLPKRKARAVMCDGDPDEYEEFCVTPMGDRIPW